jgi:hypothetical protein
MRFLKLVALSVLILALLPLGIMAIETLLPGWTMARNTNAPASVRDVVAYKEGNGLILYVTLADSRGTLTSADGVLEVTIREDGWPVWANTYTVHREQFVGGKVGLGTFERTILLYSLGRIAASHFQYLPRVSRLGTSDRHALTIDVTFRVQGQALTGTTTAWL